MRKAILFILLIMVFGILTFARAQKNSFITVEGTDLRAKLKETLRLRHESPRPTNFWVAYSFDVKPGMAIDAPVTEPGGQTFTLDLATGSLPYETRNVGTFLLYAADGRSILRGDLYNLDRQRDYNGYPVYWLGRSRGEESLSLLQEIVLSSKESATAKRLTEAIAVHNQPSVETTLRNIVYSASDEQARLTAIKWLGRNHGERSLYILSEATESPEASVELQQEAVRAIGLNPADEAVSILIRIAKSHAKAEVRQEAVRQLGGRTDERAQRFLRELRAR